MGNDHLSIAPYEPLRAKDGLIIVAVANPRLWIRFCEAIGRPDLRDDPRFLTNDSRVEHREALKAEIERAFAALTVEEVETALRRHSVPCGRVRSTRGAIEHPQVAARGTLLTQTHPAVGAVQTLGPVVIPPNSEMSAPAIKVRPAQMRTIAAAAGSAMAC